MYDWQNQITPSPDPRQLQPRIGKLMLPSGKASDMVSSLRRLMIRGQDPIHVTLLRSMETVFPILHGAAQQSGIDLGLSCQVPPRCCA